MAYQMVDDLLDIQGSTESLGKPAGNDLLQGVLTLPTIMLMERYPDANPVQSLFQDRWQDGNIKRALEMIKNSDIIEGLLRGGAGLLRRSPAFLGVAARL